MSHPLPASSSQETDVCVVSWLSNLVELNERVPIVRCPRDTFYMRQEK